MAFDGRGPEPSRSELACARSRCRTPSGLRRGTPVRRSGEPLRVPVGEAVLGRVLNADGRTGRSWSTVARRCAALVDPPTGADARAADQLARAVRDRDQGDRPAGADRARRQGRHVRWRRRRQDRGDHGADPHHGRDLHRHLGVRRHRRALARGARAAAGDAPVGCFRPNRAGLRPDERAAGREVARGLECADHR